MIEYIQRLIDALRLELQEYGEMLRLLDRQHQFIMVRDAEEVFQSIVPIQAQGCAIQNACARREDGRRGVALAVEQADDSTFAVLIPLLPPDYRPLIKALVDENNELLLRVRQRARQNHLLLSRSVELMQGLLDTLLPSRETRVYTGHGTMHTHTIVTRSSYEAVG
ncbi:MAG TPA: flagellar export chaperone FlgN [Verrucomicrobiae bacterium]|nr:flagellar export chaperone FlgN [Verrucomicrobiae bacterium]